MGTRLYTDDPYIPVAIGIWLKAARLACNLKQSQLAEAVQIDLSYVGLMEKGTRQPRVDLFIRLCLAMGRLPGEALTQIYLQIAQHNQLIALVPNASGK
jgi:transcriptional regulator with XRE-family HTH domain